MNNLLARVGLLFRPCQRLIVSQEVENAISIL
jgi:hypothetical protein